MRTHQESAIMKKLFPAVLFLILTVFLHPSTAGAVYRIEVLQAGKNACFEQVYQGIVKGLEHNGISPEDKVMLSRTVIDVNPAAEPYNWENLRVLMRIKSAADEIVQRRPDLVITIGTPATKFARLKIVGAGIPLVFACVADPEVVGCLSKTLPGPGFTGVTVHVDPADVMRVARQGLPAMKKIGLIYSDDDFAVAHSEEIRVRAAELGMEVVSKHVNLWDSMTPAAEELISQGVDTFFIPMDRYYWLKDFEHSKALMKISSERKIPCISSLPGITRGALLYNESDYSAVGSLTADSAAKILKHGVRPETIPVARHEYSILVDAEAFRKLGIEIPPKLLSRTPRHGNGHS